jgi:hypothetical protein
MPEVKTVSVVVRTRPCSSANLYKNYRGVMILYWAVLFLNDYLLTL